MKAGLVELVDDDRAVSLGAMLNLPITLRGDRREQVLIFWRRHGKQSFAVADDDDARA